MKQITKFVYFIIFLICTTTIIAQWSSTSNCDVNVTNFTGTTDVAKMDAALLLKIEGLTLYSKEMNKKIELLEAKLLEYTKN